MLWSGCSVVRGVWLVFCVYWFGGAALHVWWRAYSAGMVGDGHTCVCHDDGWASGHRVCWVGHDRSGIAVVHVIMNGTQLAMCQNLCALNGASSFLVCLFLVEKGCVFCGNGDLVTKRNVPLDCNPGVLY